MRTFFLGAAFASLSLLATPLAAQGNWDRHHDRGDYDRGGYDRGDRDDRGYHDRGHGDWQRGRNYDWNRPDPRYGGYDAARYYRPGQYRERRLGRNDRIYRGGDGRYYCRRSDGTTGLIVGGVLGGVLGNAVANGHSSTLATLLGAGGGALLGQSIDRGNVRCR
jgi:hypothetical protein